MRAKKRTFKEIKFKNKSSTFNTVDYQILTKSVTGSEVATFHLSSCPKGLLRRAKSKHGFFLPRKCGIGSFGSSLHYLKIAVTIKENRDFS